MVDKDLGDSTMDNKVCFMFGHATTPYDAISLIEAEAEKQYNEQSIRTFIVGNRGNFDSLAATAIKNLKKKYSDISYWLTIQQNAPYIWQRGSTTPIILPWRGFPESMP